MRKTNVISIRIPSNVRKRLDYYSEILRLKPSALSALILEDSIEYWVKKYSEETFNKIWKQE